MKHETAAVGATPRFGKGSRVPSVALRNRSSGEALDLRPHRAPRVYVTLHSAECDECVRYLDEIAAAREPVQAWGADIVVVRSDEGGTDTPVLLRLGVPVLEDPGHVLSDGRLSVIIADEWGEVYFAGASGATHDVVSADEVVEWVKFVSIQCPECEGPEGEWRNL